MRMMTFAKRNIKEILREPLGIILGLGFPIVMLILLSVLNKSIPTPVSMFDINVLTPGIAVFSFTFTTLFAGLLIAQDRASSFLTRLYSSPMKSGDFILGYMLPMLPLTVAQSMICFAAAMFFGYELGINTLWSVLLLIPSGVFYVALGVLMGSVFSDKVVGGVGSIVINLATLSAGVWFPLEDMKGTAFYKVCTNMPFYHTVNVGRGGDIGKSLIWVIASSVVMTVIAAAVFKYKMSSDNK